MFSFSCNEASGRTQSAAVIAVSQCHQDFSSFYIFVQTWTCHLLLTKWLFNLQHQVSIPQSKASQSGLLTFGQDDSLLWETVLYAVGCLAILMASTC